MIEGAVVKISTDFGYHYIVNIRENNMTIASLVSTSKEEVDDILYDWNAKLTGEYNYDLR